MKKVLVFALSFLSVVQTLGKIELRSLRLKFTRPSTAHELVLPIANEKYIYDLSPKNNERLGLFFDFKNFLIGYAVDVFRANQETKTIDLDFSTEKFKNHKVGLNFQILENLDSNLEEAFSGRSESRFEEGLKSQKIEVYSLHNFYNFFGQDLFDNFFLTRPFENTKNTVGLSLVGSFVVRHLRLKNRRGIITEPSFFVGTFPQIPTSLEAFSASGSLGPMLSLGFKNRFNAFLEAKPGLGFFQNLNDDKGLKESGTEFLQNYGLGFSWLSRHQKLFIVSRAWFQRGRHITATFGNVDLVYFF